MNAPVRLVVASVCVSVACSAALADSTTSPGKNTVHADKDSVPITAIVVSGQILKGKKKTVLEIDGTIRLDTITPDNIVGVGAQVNGYNVQPSPGDFQSAYCDSSYPCSVQGSFWVDIDAMELAHPGEFAGQPLDIDLFGAASGPAVNGDVSLRARVVKK